MGISAQQQACGFVGQVDAVTVGVLQATAMAYGGGHLISDSGATCTADGLTLTPGKLFLFTAAAAIAQTGLSGTGHEAGVYLVVAPGVDLFTAIRVAQLNASPLFALGALVTVGPAGSTMGGSIWFAPAASTFVLDTTVPNFIRVDAAAAGAGVSHHDALIGTGGPPGGPPIVNPVAATPVGAAVLAGASTYNLTAAPTNGSGGGGMRLLRSAVGIGAFVELELGVDYTVAGSVLTLAAGQAPVAATDRLSAIYVAAS